MDLNDILGPSGLGPSGPRPEHPDMDRIIEITAILLADMHENAGNPAEQERLWRKRIEDLVDFDSIGYKAMQEAMSLFEIQTGADYLAMKTNPERAMNFVRVIQAFYDGFIIGALFEQHGGKR